MKPNANVNHFLRYLRSEEGKSDFTRAQSLIKSNNTEEIVKLMREIREREKTKYE